MPRPRSITLSAAVPILLTTQGILPHEVVEAVLWHAVQDTAGAHAAFLDGELSPALVERMQAEGWSTVWTVDVRWKMEFVPLDDTWTGLARYPVMTVSTYALEGDALYPGTAEETWGVPAVYRVHTADDAHWADDPEAALQEVVDKALAALPAPTWSGTDQRRPVPVVLAASPAYRRFYADAWRAEAMRRVQRADALLASTGLRLEVRAYEDWPLVDDQAPLTEALADLADQPRSHPDAIRIGFVQTRPSDAPREAADIGRAYQPGRDVVLVDQPVEPGQSVGWDVAQEGTTLAHEVLHALGVPHTDDPHALMSAIQAGHTWRTTGPTRELAVAAAAARWPDQAPHEPSTPWTVAAPLVVR